MQHHDPRRGSVSESRQRVALGVPELDHYLWGGIPQGSVALVIGGQYVGKEALAQMFLGAGIRAGEPTMAILTDSAVDEWKGAIQPHVRDEDLEDAKNIVFLDFFPDEGDDSKGKNVVEIPRPLTAEKTAKSCHIALDKAGEQGCTGRFMFDSLSTLIHEGGMTELYDHLPPLMARVRRSQATGMVLIEEGVLEPHELRIIQRWFDGIIQLQSFEETDAVRIEGLGLTMPSPWIRYQNLGSKLTVNHHWSGGRIH